MQRIFGCAVSILQQYRNTSPIQQQFNAWNTISFHLQHMLSFDASFRTFVKYDEDNE